MEVPGLKPREIFPTFFAHVFYFSVTVLIEYLNLAFFSTCLVLLYISLANTLSTFKPQKVCTTIVTSCSDQFSSYSIKRIILQA